MTKLTWVLAIALGVTAPSAGWSASRPGEESYQKAMTLIRAQNYWEARSWLQFASKDGHPEAQYLLARQLMGYDGGGAPKPEEALKWAKRSLAGGHAPAAKLIEEIEHPKPVVKKSEPPAQPQPQPQPTSQPVKPSPVYVKVPETVVPAFPTGKKVPQGAYACKACDGRGRYSKVSTWTEWKGGWGNNPYVVETKKTGMAEFQCKTCNGRGYVY